MKHLLVILVTLSTLLCFTWIYFMIEIVEDEQAVQVGDEEILSKNNREIDNIETKDGTESEVVSEIEESSIFDEFQEIPEERFDGYVELDDGNYYNFKVDRIISPVIDAAQHAETKQLPYILWWTPFSGDTVGKIKRCWHGDCLFTSNRLYYNHSLTKAFLFYGTDFNISNLPLPRKAHHEWGLLHEESPKNQPLFSYKDTVKVFNHTSTFRRESHYPITTQYIISPSYLLNPLKYTVHEKDIIKREEKLASVVYIQTGCNPPSDRDAYINELQKYVQIDCYGKCLHNKDLPPEYMDSMTMFNKGFVEILQKYKFIISFENGICNDYVTEKLYRTLFVGALPIYKGAPNVKDWLPNTRSAIVVDDFKTPKDLAEFINFVDENPAEYEKYMEYKSTGITNPLLKSTLHKRQWGVDTMYKMSFITGFECHVCDEIHKNRKLVTEGKPPVEHKASFEHYGCPAPNKYELPSVHGDEGWERDIWIWEYEEAASKVEELKRVLGT